MKIKNSLKLRPYYTLDKGFTQIPNTMIKYIDSLPAFKVYVYLCNRYNEGYQYSFPSLKTIANDCSISRATVQNAIKYLEERKFIVKYKRKDSKSSWVNNCYYVRYVVETEEDKRKEEREIIDKFEKILGDEFETEIEIHLDENGNVITEEDEEEEE